MKLGSRGEELAVTYLNKKGFRVIERNYRNSFGEIDIVASHKKAIVFIEVKSRRSDGYGMPFEAVDERKREKIKKVAMMYLKKFKKEVPVRFDVVSISFSGVKEEVHHIIDAFEV